jgi:hypothetical protein
MLPDILQLNIVKYQPWNEIYSIFECVCVCVCFSEASFSDVIKKITLGNIYSNQI